jgi:CRP/FNR family transcriptional regulator, cyclic AMP receptor protein
MTPDTSASLHGLPFFEEFRARHMDKLLTLGTEVQFAKDEIIFHEDEEAKLFYVILSGRVALDAVVAGRNVRIQVLYAGEDLGWSAVLSQTRQFQARALEPVKAMAFEIATLRGACEANPYFGCAFFERMFTLVADRLQSTREQLAAALVESKR